MRILPLHSNDHSGGDNVAGNLIPIANGWGTNDASAGAAIEAIVRRSRADHHGLLDILQSEQCGLAVDGESERACGESFVLSRCDVGASDHPWADRIKLQDRTQDDQIGQVAAANQTINDVGQGRKFSSAA